MAKVKAFRDRHGLGSILTLPYQPLERLAASLSSADLQVVVLGDAFAGIVHPCKIYNILALGLPFLAIGPPESHLNDLAGRLASPGAAWQVRHGDVAALLRSLHEARALGFRGPQPKAMALAAEFSRGRLCGRLVELLEQAAAAPRP